MMKHHQTSIRFDQLQETERFDLDDDEITDYLSDIAYFIAKLTKCFDNS